MHKMTNKKHTKYAQKRCAKYTVKNPGAKKNLETESGGGRGGVSKIVSPKNGNYLIPHGLILSLSDKKWSIY